MARHSVSVSDRDLTNCDQLLSLDVLVEPTNDRYRRFVETFERHCRKCTNTTETTLQEGGKPCESNIQQHDKNKKPQKIRQRLVQSAKGKTPTTTDDGYEPKNTAIKTKLHPPQQNIVQ